MSMYMSAYAASSAPGPRFWRGTHRADQQNGLPAVWVRVLLALLAFVLSAVSLAGGTLLLGYNSATMAEHLVPLTLLTLSGAGFTTFIAAITLLPGQDRGSDVDA